MTENQTSVKTLSFKFRRASAGGVDDTIIISLATKKPLSSLLKGSGRHGTRNYLVAPGRYIIYQVWRSNRGSLGWVVKLITVGQDGNTILTEEMYGPLERHLPQWLMDILAANRDSLPLFSEVFPL